MMITLPAPTKESVEIILKYAPDRKKLQSKALEFDTQGMHKALQLFSSVVYVTDFMVQYDWMSEFPEGSVTLQDSIALENADEAQLRKLLIAHLRLDHFLNGHLEEIFLSGYLEKLLKRLTTLYSIA